MRVCLILLITLDVVIDNGRAQSAAHAELCTDETCRAEDDASLASVSSGWLHPQWSQNKSKLYEIRQALREGRVVVIRDALLPSFASDLQRELVEGTRAPPIFSVAESEHHVKETYFKERLVSEICNDTKSGFRFRFAGAKWAGTKEETGEKAYIEDFAHLAPEDVKTELLATVQKTQRLTAFSKFLDERASLQFFSWLFGRTALYFEGPSAYIYRPERDYATVHNDFSANDEGTGAFGVRMSAMNLHLSTNWTDEERYGGHLVWCEPTFSLAPRFNQLVLFNIRARTFHYVEPVHSASKKTGARRLTLTGWWGSASNGSVAESVSPLALNGKTQAEDLNFVSQDAPLIVDA